MDQETKDRIIQARELATDIEARFNTLCAMDLVTATGLAGVLRQKAHYGLQEYWERKDKESKHVDEPTPSCPGQHNCEKIKMILDKDLLPEQCAAAVWDICEKCREEK